MLGPGRVHDRALPLDLNALPEGALQVAESLGFFDFKLFSALDSRGSYWLSRLKAGTVVLDRRTGRRYDLVRLLGGSTEPELEMEVLLGEAARLPARLVAVRVEQQVADERKRKLHKEALRRQQPVSGERLALAEWNIAVTNAPTELLGLEEAFSVLRARWQIEQLFSLWKKHGELDKSRSTKPWRVLCEVYAKLIALLIQHWVFLISNWAYPDRSLMKASRTVRAHALLLGRALAESVWRLGEVLGRLARCPSSGCRINKRRDRPPPTYHQLLALTSGGAPNR